MGYYTTVTDIDFSIPAENLDDAYKAMCELNARDDLKTGGIFGPNTNTTKPAGSRSVSNSPHRNFAWMPWNYDEEYDSAQEIFNALGFDAYIEHNGELRLTGYDDKSGSEEHFLEAVAPFVTKDSFIEWCGEDNHMYRFEFDGETMEYRHARIIWE